MSSDRVIRPLILSLFPFSFLHAVLEPGPVLGTRDSCPGLLEGGGRSHVRTLTANHHPFTFLRVGSKSQVKIF